VFVILSFFLKVFFWFCFFLGRLSEQDQQEQLALFQKRNEEWQEMVRQQEEEKYPLFFQFNLYSSDCFSKFSFRRKENEFDLKKTLTA
jgi:ABC-type dipeptide/oligopeptide/nickel transport system permease component